MEKCALKNGKRRLKKLSGESARARSRYEPGKPRREVLSICCLSAVYLFLLKIDIQEANRVYLL
jgi:hypothetical protein